MTDSLGFRKKFGVIAPSTNTSVQPEFEAMRPRGVTNHFGRIHIPNDPIRNNDDFNQLMDNIRKQMLQAVDDVMTCQPDYLIMGMSSETFWDGLEGSKKLHERVEARAGVKVSMGSDAARAALQRYRAKRLGVLTPYMPVGDMQVRRFFIDCGFEVVRLKGLQCASPVLIAHVPERELRDAIIEVNGPDVDAVIQVGTNLAMARLAGIASSGSTSRCSRSTLASIGGRSARTASTTRSRASARSCSSIDVIRQAIIGGDGACHRRRFELTTPEGIGRSTSICHPATGSRRPALAHRRSIRTRSRLRALENFSCCAARP